MDYQLKKKVNTIYVFKKGAHYASPRFKFGFTFFAPYLQFTVYFTEECAYTGDAQLEEQVNKLFGYTSFPFFPHINSRRIGWRFNKKTKKIDLYDYQYRWGKRTIKLIENASVGLNEWCTIRLYGYKLNSIFGFRLFPYFGGKAPAPHEMAIYFHK